MALTLSSAAAPDATLVELLAAAGRRGIANVELVEGHAHGVVGEGGVDVPGIRAAVREAGVGIGGYYAPALDAWRAEPLLSMAAALGAPLVVPAERVESLIVPEVAEAASAAGARLLLAIGNDPAQAHAWLEIVEKLGDAIGLAWEVKPGTDDHDLYPEVLSAAWPRLRYVRLHGGGPEAAQQTGRGVGGLMARLTLAGYGGPLVLTPTTPRYHQIWRTWLGRAGGWGCGSKQSDPSLVTLERDSVTS